MTITEFLTARYDEEELMAAAAIDDDSGQDGGFEDAYEDLIRPPSGVGTAQGGFGQAVARMIVWNTPRRVLADVAAKRAIVALLIQSERTLQEDVIDEATLLAARHGLLVAQMACRSLTQPYAEHPDFNPAWRV